ncbi:MAG: cytochrome D1 domain-containing protein [Phycisphaerales bacterium]
MNHALTRTSCVLATAFFAAASCLGQTTTRASAQAAPGTGTLIVLNKDGASASLLDRATGEEFAKLDTGVGPHEVAVSPDGRFAVVGNYGAREPGHTLSVIDLVAKSVVKTIDLVKYHRPHGIVFLPDGERIIVTAEAERKLLVVNVETGAVEKAIDTDAQGSHMVVLSPDAKRAYVANIGSGSLTAIDLAKSERIKIVQTGRGAEGMDISPDGREIWVANRAEDTVSVVDTESLEVVATLKCATFPIRLKFTPDGERVLVSNARSGDVAVFDAHSREILKRIEMAKGWQPPTDADGNVFSQGPVPIGILIPPDGKHAYVANTNVNRVTVIDLETLTITGRLTAGLRPDGLGYSPLVLAAD